MFSRADISKCSVLVMVIALIGSLTVTSASGFALHKKESKASIEKYIDSAVPVLEIEENRTTLDSPSTSINLQNFQLAHFVSMPLPAVFDFQVYFFPPHLRVTFTHAP